MLSQKKKILYRCFFLFCASRQYENCFWNAIHFIMSTILFCDKKKKKDFDKGHE